MAQCARPAVGCPPLCPVESFGTSASGRCALSLRASRGEARLGVPERQRGGGWACGCFRSLEESESTDLKTGVWCPAQEGEMGVRRARPSLCARVRRQRWSLCLCVVAEEKETPFFFFFDRFCSRPWGGRWGLRGPAPPPPWTAPEPRRGARSPGVTPPVTTEGSRRAFTESPAKAPGPGENRRSRPLTAAVHDPR